MATVDDKDSLTLEDVDCPLCESDESVVYLRMPDLLYQRLEEMRLVRCRNCRHIYLNPRPTLDSIGIFYPEDYPPYHLNDPTPPAAGANEPPPHRPWYLSPAARAIPGLRRLYYWLADDRSEILPSPPAESARALELGCASGRFLEQLRAAGWQCQGVELSAAASQRARERGFEVHCGTLESAQFADGQFDAVFAWMVLEHLHDPKATLAEIRRTLKPGGLLAFSVPNIGCWEPVVFGRYCAMLQMPHLQHFTPRALDYVLNESGFGEARMIHQRNALYPLMSAGLWLRTRFPSGDIGPRLMAYAENPTMWRQLALAPLAKLLGWTRQSGRLTVTARRTV